MNGAPDNTAPAWAVDVEPWGPLGERNYTRRVASMSCGGMRLIQLQVSGPGGVATTELQGRISGYLAATTDTELADELEHFADALLQLAQTVRGQQ